MTLTFPVLDRARNVLWLVTGGEKVPMLKRLRRCTTRRFPPGGCDRTTRSSSPTAPRPEKRRDPGVLRLLPGLALILAIAIPVRLVQSLITVAGKEVVSAVALAIVAGILIRNVLGLSDTYRPGTGFAVKRLLRVGIALMGAQLSLAQVVETGGSSLLVVTVCIVSSLLVVRFLAVRMGMSDALGTLLGIGTSICGVSAIVATAPVIEAKEEETSLAVATITVFGLLAVLVYPLLGRFWGLSDTFFGTWAGTAVNDTSQVVATGLIYSQQAGETATVVKLTRNLFMAPVILGFRRGRGRATVHRERDELRAALHPAPTPFVKDAFHEVVVNGRREAVNPAETAPRRRSDTGASWRRARPSRSTCASRRRGTGKLLDVPFAGFEETLPAAP